MMYAVRIEQEEPGETGERRQDSGQEVVLGEERAERLDCEGILEAVYGHKTLFRGAGIGREGIQKTTQRRNLKSEYRERTT